MSKRRLSSATPCERRSLLGFSSASGALKKTSDIKKKLSFSSEQKASARSYDSASKVRSNVGAHMAKDTRPLAKKSYQNYMIDSVMKFLSSNTYPHRISVKILTGPTAKEFLQAFEFLYKYLSPEYVMDQKKYQDEVPKLLKEINYPFPISKSTMCSVGTMHSWPHLLGVLHWLTELIKVMEETDIEKIMFPPSDKLKKLFFDFNSRMYLEFLRGEDDFEEQYKILEDMAMAQSGCSVQELNELKSDVAELQEEYDTLVAEKDIYAEASKLKAHLQDVVDQDRQELDGLDHEHDFLLQRHAQLKKQIKAGGHNIQTGDPSKQEKLRQICAEVDAQKNQLESEKELLEQQVDERELCIARLQKKFSDTADGHNRIAMQLKHHPIVQKYIDNEPILLELNSFANNLNDIKQRIKPILVTLSHQVSEHRCKLEGEKIDTDHKLEQMLEELSTKENVEYVQLKQQYDQLAKELDAVAESQQKKYKESMDQLEEEEKLLDASQKEANENYDNMKRKFAEENKKYQEAVQLQKRQRKEAAEGIEKFKEHYRDYRAFVVTQVGKTINRSENHIKAKEKELAEATAMVSNIMEIRRGSSGGYRDRGIIKYRDLDAPEESDFF